MKFTFTASVEQFDKDKYMVAVKDAIRQCFMQGGKKFLLAAIPKVPVWTGMARGAFRSAEDLFGKVTADAQSGGYRIRTTRNAGQGRGGGEKVTTPYRKGYYYYPPTGGRVARTPQSGRQFATPTDQILDGTGASLASGRTAFYFRYEVDIKYFDILDQARWGAMKAGAAALEEYVRENLNLPSPLEFMTRKIIKVG
jgi:hypothetical protein